MMRTKLNSLWIATAIVFLFLLPRSAQTQTSQSVVLQLVEVKQDPPCTAWGDITSCDLNAGHITWGGATNTDYQWTPPPQQFGPEGFTIAMSASEHTPPDRSSATGLQINGGYLELDPPNAQMPIGTPNPMSASLTVTVKPPKNASGDYWLTIGVFWGPGIRYHYRATAGPITPPTPPPSSCSWTGTWKVNNETFSFVQNGTQVTGTGVTDPSWRLSGTVAGNVLTGKWSNSKDSGSIRITMNANCNSFSSSWGPGNDTTTFTGNGGRTSSGPTTTPEPNTGVSNMTIQAAQRQVIAGDLVLVPVWLIKANNVANINFQISYDPNVVRPEGAPTKGNLLDNAIFSVNANQSGNILSGFAQTSGLSGTGTVLNIPFRAIGKPGDQTPLGITVTAINDPSGKKLSIDRIPGEIWIYDKNGTFPTPPTTTTGGTPIPPPPPPPPNIVLGDCDGDGSVTELDAVCALEISVQLRPSNSNLDVDHSGVVDSRDAVIILQRALKK